jgi:predicted phosphatase
MTSSIGKIWKLTWQDERNEVYIPSDIFYLDETKLHFGGVILLIWVVELRTVVTDTVNLLKLVVSDI